MGKHKKDKEKKHKKDKKDKKKERTSSKSSSKSSTKSSKRGKPSKGASKTSSMSKSKAPSKSVSSASKSKALKKQNEDDGGMKLSINAESVSPASQETVAKNQEQVDMIVGLLEGVSTDFVTRHIKDDLDRIQTLVKNITYREAGELKRVIKVHFTDQQKAVIKQVCGHHEPHAKADATENDESEMSVTHDQAMAGYVPKLRYPYIKLELVPTRLSAARKSRKK